MILCFELSMPSVNSWNGKWTGESELHARIVNFGRSQKSNKSAKEILNKGYFRYDFGDGWAAGVSVREINTKESAKIRRKSAGFCGYDWMIDSIRKHNKII